MSIKIININCAEKWIGPGMSGLFAELKAEKWNDEGIYEGEFYISVMDVIGSVYTVSNNSLFGYYDQEFEDLDEIEHYETLSDAAKSEYFNYFIYLEKMINDLNSNFECVASVEIEDRVRTKEIQINDEEDYYLAAVDTFKQDGKTLKATVCYGTISNSVGIGAEIIDISLVDENDELIEGFEDFDEAIKSEYLMIYCDLNNYLKECLLEHLENESYVEYDKNYFISLFEPQY